MTDKPIVTSKSTIPQVFKEAVRLYPDHIAQVDGDERMTYRDFGDQVEKLASALLDLGIQPGEKVALVLPDGNTFPVAMYAIIQMGGVSVGINPTLRPNEFKHIFGDSEAVAVIVAEEIHGVNPLAIVRDMRAELPNLRFVIVDGHEQGSEINLRNLIDGATVREEYHQADPDDLAALIYTSGTTGLPKGSMHSHTTMLYPMTLPTQDPPVIKAFFKLVSRYGLKFAFRAVKSIGKPLVAYYSMPPYTGAGMMGVIGLYLMGHEVVHLDRFTPVKALELIEKEKITGIGMPPALGLMLVRNPDLEKYDLSSLIYVLLAASPVPPALIDEFREKIGCVVLNGFGTTELFGGPTALDPFIDSITALRETVGKVKPDFEAKVVDEEHKTQPVGVVGELAVKSGVKMLGYYKAEELNQKTFSPEGWYFTGDQATIDHEGYVRIVGRIKDMIIRGGQNIYPAEIENVLVTHPKIEQAAVIGVPDALAGEKVLAYVISKGKNGLTPIDVLNFCRENMAAYKVPANVFIVDELPLNATGKVLKRELREQAMSNKMAR